MFKDVLPGKWYYSLIERMLKKKAVSGYPDNTFKPEELIKRAEVLSFIEKAQTHEYELIPPLLPSVVTVRAKLKDGRTSLGSGIVLDKDGYIATNCHVVLDGLDPSQEINVILDSLPANINAKVLYGDLGQDIAILKIAADSGLLMPVEFPDEPVKLLDKVFCIGNPLGFTDTVSAGIVSCSKRVIGGNEWIQTDAAINPGNSGGGAFNVKGQFIGLPTFIIVWADEQKTIPVSNIGFISPYYKVAHVYQQAKSGKVAFAGEQVREIVFANLF
ncbi:trypsin-like peptidase domain-containing protein [Thermanaerosceptrum fracticalcis]|uniref:trypsin-like peptidase domain-containing protein n=1 Tax=Thermanaerosceptrum fracticalcis TaxID=1712410 RepID=UPI0013773E11|nr:trypsin-like peptidase domain-containing protein [Thermanaerosceptrum fracticalcis]